MDESKTIGPMRDAVNSADRRQEEGTVSVPPLTRVTVEKVPVQIGVKESSWTK